MSKMKGGVVESYKYLKNVVISDPEVENAKNADEKPQYFRRQMRNGGWAYDFYKPSFAKLMTERDGMKRIPVPYNTEFTSENNLKKLYPTQRLCFSWDRGEYYIDDPGEEELCRNICGIEKSTRAAAEAFSNLAIWICNGEETSTSRLLREFARL